MRPLGEMARLREPDFYEVLWVVEIATTDLGIRPSYLGVIVYLVEFADGELAVPMAEPIGVFGDGKGDRQYIWRDAFWAETDPKILGLAPDHVRQRINPPRPGITSVRRLLYRVDRGMGGWNGGTH